MPAHESKIEIRSVVVTFTDQGGPIINDALDLKWTHVGVKLNGIYYEATWPRVTTSQSLKHRKLQHHVLWLPTPIITSMEEYAKSLLGTRYSALGYFIPNLYGKTVGIYCSQYACYILRAGGIEVSEDDGRDPDRLLAALEKLRG